VVEGMRKTWLIVMVLLAFTVVGTVSAFGPIHFSSSGDLVVTFISETAGYNNEFGIAAPHHVSLGFTGETPPGTVYKNLGSCSPEEPVVLYCKSPPEGGSVTYYSHQGSGDGFDHAMITTLGGGSFNVGFEDVFGPRENPDVPGDGDYDDVVLNVACVRYAAPPFEDEPSGDFPVIALPAGFLCGIIGSALFIRRTREQ
jgi:hypothetical protein